MKETRYPYRLQLSVKCHVVCVGLRKRHFNHQQLRMAELGNYLTCPRERAHDWKTHLYRYLVRFSSSQCNQRKTGRDNVREYIMPRVFARKPTTLVPLSRNRFGSRDTFVVGFQTLSSITRRKLYALLPGRAGATITLFLRITENFCRPNRDRFRHVRYVYITRYVRLIKYR